jgi:lysophospholipase L1-like esterase
VSNFRAGLDCFFIPVSLRMRAFMKSLFAIGTLFWSLHAVGFAAETNAAVFATASRILFQGDSITDGSRNRKGDYNPLGNSYPMLIAAKYGTLYPERKLEFFNRGISGNKVPDLLNRWQPDALELQPTVVSILIGVNDIWHPLNGNQEVSVEKFEAGYDQLLAQTRAALPNAKIILLEPFITPGSATSSQWDVWQGHVQKFQAVVAKLGKKHHAPVVPLQRVFDEACRRAPAKYWVFDGVHPTAAGHQLIADEWVRVAAATWPVAQP